MITRLKYTGTEEGGSVTQNNSYLVLGFATFNQDNAQAVVIDDLGRPYVTQTAIDNPSNWEIDTITECGEQIYPPV